MALFLRQNDNRSELQTRIATELRERLKERDRIAMAEPEQSEHLKNHHTRTAGMLIAALLVLLVVAVTVWATTLR